jgi:DNA-binding NtrC family response regulator
MSVHDECRQLEDAVRIIRGGGSLVLDETLDRIERYLIAQAVGDCGGDLARVAQVLSLTEADLRYRLRLFDLSAGGAPDGQNGRGDDARMA